MTALRHRAFALALLLPVAPSAVHAEPLQLTGHLMTIEYTGLRLASPGIDLDGEVFSALPTHRCAIFGSSQPCIPGQRTSLGLHITGIGEAGGVVDGVTYERFVDFSGDIRGELRLNFDLMFSGPEFTLPALLRTPPRSSRLPPRSEWLAH